VLNCPFALYPPAMNMTCVPVDALRSAVDDPPPNFPAVCVLQCALLHGRTRERTAWVYWGKGWGGWV
jgi:hypothetical protein